MSSKPTLLASQAHGTWQAAEPAIDEAYVAGVLQAAPAQLVCALSTGAAPSSCEVTLQIALDPIRALAPSLRVVPRLHSEVSCSIRSASRPIGCHPVGLLMVHAIRVDLR